MRSYHYHEGIWKVIDDPMSEVTSSYEDYAFSQALGKRGLSGSSDDYESQIGTLRVYSRDHSKLPAKRGQTGSPYDFMAIIRIGSSFVRIWITDLPNMLLFMREIDARKKTPIESFLERSNIHEMVSSIEQAADSITNGYLEVTIKQPKTK